MKKNKKKIIKITLILFALIVGIDIFTKGSLHKFIASVNPMNLKASDVPYTNNSQTTVQGAIDDLYTSTSGYSVYKDMVCPGCVYRKSTTRKYNSNASGADGTNNKLTSSEYTTDYTTLNSNYFLGHVIDSSGNILASYACGINNGVFFCLRGADSDQSSLTYKPFYQENVNRMNQVFSRCNATTSGYNAECTGSIGASAITYGSAAVTGSDGNCAVSYEGYSRCI